MHTLECYFGVYFHGCSKITPSWAHKQFTISVHTLFYVIDHEIRHWGRGQMAAILQMTFSKAFSWIKIFEFQLKFHWCLFQSVQLIISQYWFRWWLGAKPLPEPIMTSPDAFIYITRLQYNNGNLLRCNFYKLSMMTSILCHVRAPEKGSTKKNFQVYLDEKNKHLGY